MCSLPGSTGDMTASTLGSMPPAGSGKGHIQYLLQQGTIQQNYPKRCSSLPQRRISRGASALHGATKSPKPTAVDCPNIHHPSTPQRSFQTLQGAYRWSERAGTVVPRFSRPGYSIKSRPHRHAFKHGQLEKTLGTPMPCFFSTSLTSTSGRKRHSTR